MWYAANQVVAARLMVAEGLSAAAAVQAVQQQRPIIQPNVGFLLQVSRSSVRTPAWLLGKGNGCLVDMLRQQQQHLKSEEVWVFEEPF